ncbi:mechanosensitive ion channel family protein [Spirulina subsalsa FACHB-351]|uniref:Mechanosensitive ion channel family protein n=1 Tax=Spirulina subsalsa FACHB-351 TaxID=234711 RepID=A0ABT3L9Y7_9CYAN|nr:mechanosensitive ion channel family protein [Spirulina subsalsa]MCW6037929.1 mechanosensitive ion channel family protein [Spirulina subsalsa FACHB-351]
MNSRKKFITQGICAFLLILLSQSVLFGTSSPNPLTPPATNSPRATLTEFVTNMNETYSLLMAAQAQSQQERGFRHSPAVLQQANVAQQAFERAVKTLDLTEVPSAIRSDMGAESALLLKEILDRVPLPPFSSIPDQQVVEDESLERWILPHTEITLVLIQDGVNAGQFLFSAETIKRLHDFYDEIKSLPYQSQSSPNFYQFYIGTPGYLIPPKWSNGLPRWTMFMIGEQALWQWVVFGLGTLLAIAILWGMYKILGWYYTGSHSVQEAWSGLLLPFSFMVVVTGWVFFVNRLINITGDTLQKLLTISIVLDGMIAAWLTFLTLNAVGRTIIAAPQFKDQHLETTIVRNGFRLIGFIAATTVLYYASEAVGIPVGPFFASLGVSSIAIGFGMRPYVENIVGGITLFVNRPMKIGDFCEFGGNIGTIEDIGLRATLIRTTDRKLIFVPNTVVSTSQIVNHSRRDKYTFTCTLTLSYEATRQQLTATMNNLRNMLNQHPNVMDERITLVELNGTTIKLELFAYISTKDREEYLKIQEELWLKIEEVLALTEAQLK